MNIKICPCCGKPRKHKVGTKKHQPKFAAKDFGYREKDNGFNSKERTTFDITAPATELAQAWEGHRYGGQVLKPAFEFICVAQKPYQGRPVECITRTGAGALNIDGGRIGRAAGDRFEYGVDGDENQTTGESGIYGRFAAVAPYEPHNAGRWPANLMLDEATAERIDRQSGYSESKRSDRGKVEIFDELYKRAPSWHGESTVRGHDDAGGASRFFFCADYMYERLEEADSVAYFAKADRAEREAGLDPRQVRLMNAEAFTEATINDGRAKSIDNAYQRGETTRRNIHPTVKPLSLCKYLATLLLPPDMYAPRRLLVPFAGVASEVIGAELAGWEEVVGVELEAAHVAIAEARRSYWRQMRYKVTEAALDVSAKISEKVDEGQLELF